MYAGNAKFNFKGKTKNKHLYVCSGLDLLFHTSIKTPDGTKLAYVGEKIFHASTLIGHDQYKYTITAGQDVAIMIALLVCIDKMRDKA